MRVRGAVLQRRRQNVRSPTAISASVAAAGPAVAATTVLASIPARERPCAAASLGTTATRGSALMPAAAFGAASDTTPASAEGNGNKSIDSTYTTESTAATSITPPTANDPSLRMRRLVSERLLYRTDQSRSCHAAAANIDVANHLHVHRY